MPFIPLDLESTFDPVKIMVLVFAAIGALLLLGMAVVSIYRTRKRPVGTRRPGYAQSALALIGAANFIVVPIFLVNLPPNPNSIGALSTQIRADRERLPEIQKQVQKAYDLELTDRQAYDLGYPYEKPPEDFAVYGSFDQKEQVDGAQFEKRTIYLVWVDGVFELSESSDGESFTPLELTE